MQYWTALEVVKQVAGELGLGTPASLSGTDTADVIQLRSLLNSAGNELLLYYPYSQFAKVLEFSTVDGQEEYDLPSDWRYFIDQTQWDVTNSWPLMGPKSPQEWTWLKGDIGVAGPRLRYRVYNNKIHIHPTPGTYDLRMEYIRSTWVAGTNEMVDGDGDVIQYDPWLINKFMKMKFYELKGLNVVAAQADFMRIFNALVGKDKGAPVLSMVNQSNELYIGPWSVPDGSWGT